MGILLSKSWEETENILELANWRQFINPEEIWRCGWDLCEGLPPGGPSSSPLDLKNLGVAPSLKPRENNSMEKGAQQHFVKLPTKINTPEFPPMLPSPAAYASHWANPTGSQGQGKPGRWSAVVHLPGHSTAEKVGRRPMGHTENIEHRHHHLFHWRQQSPCPRSLDKANENASLTYANDHWLQWELCIESLENSYIHQKTHIFITMIKKFNRSLAGEAQ